MKKSFLPALRSDSRATALSLLSLRSDALFRDSRWVPATGVATHRVPPVARAVAM